MFYETTRVGEVLSRLTTDTTLVQAISGVNLSIILRSSLSLIGGLVMLGLTSAKLMGIMLVLIPVVVVPLIVIGRRVRGLSRASQDRIADTSGLAGETLERHPDRAGLHPGGAAEPALSDRRWKTASPPRCAAPACARRSRPSASRWCLPASPLFCGWVLRQVIAGTMTGGQLFQFLLYAGFVGSSAAALTEMWGEMQRAAGAMERLSELLQARPAISAPAHPLDLPARVHGAIRFDNVTFHYPSRPDSGRARQLQPRGRARAKPSPSWVPPGPARAPRFSCCCASTIPIPAGC